MNFKLVDEGHSLVAPKDWGRQGAIVWSTAVNSEADQGGTDCTYYSLDVTKRQCIFVQ